MLAHKHDTDNDAEVPSIPKTTFLQHFWEGVLSGEYKPPSLIKRSDLVKEHLLEHAPFTPLSLWEKGEIEGMFRQKVHQMVDNDIHRIVCEHRLIYLDKSMVPLLERNGCRRIIEPLLVDIEDTKLRKEFAPLQLTPLTHQEKFDLFNDADRWEDATLRFGNCETSITMQGYRNIWEYGALWKYLFKHVDVTLQEEVESLSEKRWDLNRNHEEWKKADKALDTIWKKEFSLLVRRVRQRTGKDHIHMLDVGGGTGRGLYNVKNIDPTVITHNLTVHEEPSMYPVDHTYFCPAEWMPQEFEEKMDLIISNISIRYHTYPDITLENILRSLSVGGEAFFTMNCDRSSTSEEELKQRLFKAYALVEELVQKGYISLECQANSKEEDASWFRNKENFYAYGYVMHMTKLKSLNTVTEKQETLRGGMKELLS